MYANTDGTEEKSRIEKSSPAKSIKEGSVVLWGGVVSQHRDWKSGIRIILGHLPPISRRHASQRWDIRKGCNEATLPQQQDGGRGSFMIALTRRNVELRFSGIFLPSLPSPASLSPLLHSLYWHTRYNKERVCIQSAMRSTACWRIIDQTSDSLLDQNKRKWKQE